MFRPDHHPDYGSKSQDTTMSRIQGQSQWSLRQDSVESVVGPERSKSVAQKEIEKSIIGKGEGIIEAQGISHQASDEKAQTPPGRAQVLPQGRKTESTGPPKESFTAVASHEGSVQSFNSKTKNVRPPSPSGHSNQESQGSVRFQYNRDPRIRFLDKAGGRGRALLKKNKVERQQR